MKVSWLNRVFNSVFSKLLLIIVVTGILINVVVIGFFWGQRIHKDRIPFGKNAIHYVNYLITDLGNPPSFAKAKDISRQFHITIQFQGPDLSWTTSDKDIPNPHHHGVIIYQDTYARIMHSKGMNAIIVDKDYGKFEFSTTRVFLPEDEILWPHMVLIGILSVLLIFTFFIIRQILKPVKHLSKGVMEVGSGNLDYKISVDRSDEFGQLSEAINAMTVKIRDMLHTRERLMTDVSHELRTPITRMKVALEFLPQGKAKTTLCEDVVEESNVLIDPKMISTVLKNIVMNAIKYSDKEGEPVTVSIRKTSTQFAVEVRDSGTGIPENELPHIFEPFYRVDKSRSKHTGGFGLGLSLCKTIMDAHKGRIEVDSAPGQGTRVSLFFNMP
ncbi:MAG: HAMP domain-containing histidine kinase [Proteobacteria bacterium]|nr:HAMP domain-containing histidine kinase [Pseudomonadota bacterium]